MQKSRTYGFLSLFAATALVAILAGCGQKTESGAESTSASSTAASTAAATTAAAPVWTMPAGLDDGPRASATPVDAALAAKGKVLFTSKQCVTCHKFDVKLIGPPLGPVAGQRAAAWIKAQMQHPEVMIAQDAVSKQLLAEYKVPMTNQNVSDEEAAALLEYIKSGGK